MATWLILLITRWDSWSCATTLPNEMSLFLIVCNILVSTLLLTTPLPLSSQPVYITDFLIFKIFNNVLTTVNTTDICNFKFTKKPLDIKSSVQCSVFRFFPLSSTRCLNLIIPNITSGGLFFLGGGGGGLYMEGVFRFKSWFLNARGLYTVGLIIGILRY